MAIDSPERTTTEKSSAGAPASPNWRRAARVVVPTGAVILVGGLVAALAPDTEPVASGPNTGETPAASASGPERTGSASGIGCIVLGQPVADGLRVRVGATLDGEALSSDDQRQLDQTYSRSITVRYNDGTTKWGGLGGVGHDAIGEIVYPGTPRSVEVTLVPTAQNSGLPSIPCTPWPQ